MVASAHPVSTPCHIVVDSAIRGGKAHLAGSRITVSDVVLMHHHLGQSLEDIAATYDLSLSSVHSAMAHYYDHQEEIDHLLQVERDRGEAFRQAQPSRLKDKLANPDAS